MINFEIINKRAERTATQAHIYITVLCKGDNSKVNIWASVTQNERTYKDMKTISLQTNQKIELEFIFDITTDGYTWSVWYDYPIG
jgi:ribosome-binding factor A